MLFVNNDAKAFHDKKSPRRRTLESFISVTPFKRLLRFLLFEELLILAIEFIDATGAVNKFHLTSIEGV